MSNPVFKKVNLENNSFQCHPRAINSWRCWEAITRQSSLDYIPSKCFESFMFINPPHVIKSKEGKKTTYQYFSGFLAVSLWMNRPVEVLPLLIHGDINDDEINRLAYTSTASLLYNSLDNRSGIGEFRNTVNQYFPEEQIRKIFGKKTLSLKAYSQITGLSIGEIRWQTNSKDKLNLDMGMFSRILKDD